MALEARRSICTFGTPLTGLTLSHPSWRCKQNAYIMKMCPGILHVLKLEKYVYVYILKSKYRASGGILKVIQKKKHHNIHLCSCVICINVLWESNKWRQSVMGEMSERREERALTCPRGMHWRGTKSARHRGGCPLLSGAHILVYLAAWKLPTAEASPIPL